MRRLLTVTAALILGSLALPSNSHAQQAVNFYLGGFFPRSFDARDRNDVLRDNIDFFDFNLSDFNGPTVGAEYLVGLGEHFDAGLGVGFYSRTVHSVDASSVFEVSGASIRQDFKLRTVPFTATIRYLPIGRSDAFEPYIGAGVGVIRYRYQETGNFVDANDIIYPGTFTGTGAATGPLFLGGARFPVGALSIGGEIRYQYAKGDLPLDQFFVPKIDLGGFSYLATFKIRF